jgi:hypothetical protein
MPADQRLRRAQRSLSDQPRDVATWLRLAQDLERSGLRQRAQRALLGAAALDRFDPQVRRSLEELGVHGLWPSERGCPRNQQRAPLAGPREGVLRWRCELPRRVLGWPRVGLAGDVILRATPAGLVHVAAGGHRVELLDHWPAAVPPNLHAGAPRALDAARLAPRGPGPLPGVELAPYVEAGDWRYALLPEAVLALGPHDVPAWRLAAARPLELAASDDGPLYLAAGLPSPGRVLAVDRHTGRLLWQLDPEPAAQTPPTVSAADDGSLLTRHGSLLRCVEPDGGLRWTRRRAGTSDPATTGDRVLVCEADAGLVCLDLGSGEPRWRRAALRSQHGPVVDLEGWTYLVTHRGALAAANSAGELVFELRLGGAGLPGPVALGWDHTAYVAAGDSLAAIG